MLPKDHPNYDEVVIHLYNQIKDELADKYNATTNRPANTAGEDADFSGTEAS